MPSAFRARPIIEFKQREKSRIESLTAYDECVIVGLANGALRFYKITTHDRHDEPNERSAKTELLHEDDKSSKRPITQLAAFAEIDILVSLSDGYVSLHNLQSFTFRERLEKSKGASAFAATCEVVKDAESDESRNAACLAVAVKRRVLLWVWQDKMLVLQAKEIALQATVKSMTWISGTKLIVGMDPGFSILDIETTEVIDINKPDAAGEATVQTGGSRFGAVNTTGMGYVGLGNWAPRPMVTRLADGQALLAKDVNTLFIDDVGKALDRRQIPWSSPPDALGYSYPFLLSLQQPAKGVLDVRNPDTQALFQSIPVPNATQLVVPYDAASATGASNGFLVASDRCIWRMSPIRYEAQVDELVASARYDEAISLLNLLDDSLLTDKHGLVREVRIKKAQTLFEQRKYQPALDLFADAGAPPVKVIALFPETIGGKSTTDHPEAAEEPTEALRSADAQNQAAEAAAQLEETHKAILSTSPDTAVPADTNAINSGSSHFNDPEGLRTAVVALCGFLAQSRVQIQKYINSDGTLKTPVTIEQQSDAYAVPFKNLIPFERGTDFAMVDWQVELHRVANLVDTTLFRAYMHARPQLAGPLFRLDNFCDPHVVEEKLYASGRYTDLIDFLRGKRLHRQALELLEKFGRNDAAEEVMPALRGPGRTISYLQQLQAEDIDLILEFAKWPLEVQQGPSMEIFLADTENAELLPRDRVFSFLKSIDPSLATTYLEHIVNELDDQSPDFHQGLVDRYIAQLDSPSTKLENGARRSSLQARLEGFLRTSKQYNRGKTFRQLPTNAPDFYESRAIVLSAMGNHKQALSIYVFQLKDYEKAEEYCDEIHLARQSGTSAMTTTGISNRTQLPSTTGHVTDGSTSKQAETNDMEIYTTLLSLYLQPGPAGEKANWTPALKLLHNHGARISAKEALGLAPDDLAVAELQSYFRGRIRSDVSELNTSRVLVGLGRCLRDRVEREVVGIPCHHRRTVGVGDQGTVADAGPSAGSDQGQGMSKRQGRNRRVVIRPDSHCKVCLRRFGNAAVRVFPDGRVVHYGCAAAAAASTAIGT